MLEFFFGVLKACLVRPTFLQPHVSMADSSTPPMLDSPVFLSDENPEYDVIASENDNIEIEQMATED